MDRREQIAAIIVGAHPSEFYPATASPASRADWVAALKKADDITALTPRHEAPASVPADVARLVIAARRVAFDNPTQAELRALDIASEAFADRVPWEDEPESHEAPASEGGAS